MTENMALVLGATALVCLPVLTFGVLSLACAVKEVAEQVRRLVTVQTAALMSKAKDGGINVRMDRYDDGSVCLGEVTYMQNARTDEKGNGKGVQA